MIHSVLLCLVKFWLSIWVQTSREQRPHLFDLLCMVSSKGLQSSVTEKSWTWTLVTRVLGLALWPLKYRPHFYSLFKTKQNKMKQKNKQWEQHLLPFLLPRVEGRIKWGNAKERFVEIVTQIWFLKNYKMPKSNQNPNSEVLQTEKLMYRDPSCRELWTKWWLQAMLQLKPSLRPKDTGYRSSLRRLYPHGETAAVTKLAF